MSKKYIEDELSKHGDIESKKLPAESSQVPVHIRVLKSRIFLSTVVFITVGLVLYSVYVSRYKPDPQGTILLGQKKLFTDSFAAFRILTTDRRKSLPIADARVQLSIKGQGIKRELGNFITNTNGSLSEAVYIPPLPSGKYELIVDSHSKIGRDHIVKSIDIKHPYHVYLTTDKPIYQPGQTIHICALVLNRLKFKPYKNQEILLEILDSKGNKVLKKNLKSSEYGIASFDFELADEVNLGQYKIHTTTGDVKSQKTVTVERYVLPKFKIELTSDKPFYLPSEKLNCSINANYFFGKPVTNAQVEITGRAVFEKPTEIFKITGNTDLNGRFSFKARLADYFAGKALRAKNIPLETEIKVTDSAGHEEISKKNITIAQQSINIHIFPEGDNYLPGFENNFYIMTAYPHGQPAICDVDINGTVYKSDENGITAFTTIPSSRSTSFDIKARDHAGLKGNFTEKMTYWYSGNNLILRTDKAVYNEGETLNINIISSAGSSTFFLDIIKNGQTLQTKILPANNGKAQSAIDLSEDLCGTLEIIAYTIEQKINENNYRSSFNAISDSRVVHVRRAHRLKVVSISDKTVYQPGDTARLNFKVTDSNGIPAPSALSLSAVDEAVFYVCQNHPGTMEQFFFGDKALLRPIYDIAFVFSPAKVLSGQDKYQNLARVLFSPQARDINWRSLFSIPYSDTPESETMYPRYLQNSYGLQAETHSVKLTQAKAFRHRHIKVPFAFLRILAAIAIPLTFLGFFNHSIFRLFRNAIIHNISSTQIQTHRVEKRRIYFFAFLILLPMVMFITLIVLDDFHRTPFVSRHLYSFFETEPEFLLGGLFLLLTALASVAFPLLVPSETISTRQQRKILIIGFALSLVCIALFFIIISITAIIITDIVFISTIALSISIIIFAVSTVFYLMACRTSLKPPGRFFSRLGSSGHIVLLIGLAQTIIILVFVALEPIDDALRIFKKNFRTSTQNIIIRSGRGRIGFYGGMGGFGGGMMGGGMTGETFGNYTTYEEPARIREYFPETLFWQPELITDEKGQASIDIPVADSITNWKMNIDAVSATGKLGSSEVNIPVFQDFFVDVDLPVVLTRNDEFSIPVLCYNYLQRPQTIQLTLQTSPWYEAIDSVTKTIELSPNDVKSTHFRIKAQQVGTHELTVLAKGSKLNDAVKRSINVNPDGTKVVNLQNGILKTSASHSFNIPSETIANSQKLLLNFYPSRFSEVVEGLDNIFRMPYGCFEQTSSVTYPNVMALLYMKRTGQVTPEIEAKARKFITSGYQRLLTFEIRGGGFDLFGKPPAQEKLTAYGIMQLTDLSKVHEIDRAVIQRASKCLMSRQKNDGSWGGFGTKESRFNNKTSTANTAYIAWALAEADIKGPMLDKALAFLRQNLSETDNPYTIALAANAILDNNPNDPLGTKLVSRLISKSRVQDNSIYIPSQGVGAMHSRGSCLDIETTALSALAIMKVNPYDDTARKALTWLFEQKDIKGTWRSTQSTVLAMKALITGTDEPSREDKKSSRIDIIVNNRPAGSIEIKADMRDLLYTKNLTSYLQQGENQIHITQNQDEELLYRLMGSYWITGTSTDITPEKDLEIRVDYDKNNLSVGDIMTCNVQVAKQDDSSSGMIIIDLGVPPGFKVYTSAFEYLVKSGTLAKYEVNPNRYILYARSITQGKSLSFTYEMKALYPIRAHIPCSKVYEYYQPKNRDQTKPVFVVTKEQ